MEETTRKVIYEFQKYVVSDIFKKLTEAIENGSLKFPSWDVSWQTKMIEFFAKLGRSAGYKVYGEMEWFKIDCPWIIDLQKHLSIELLMEYQDITYLDEYLVLNDIKKIGWFKAAKKIIIYHPTFADLPNDLKEIGEAIQNTNRELAQTPEEKWLIITITNEPEGKVTFRGYEFDAKGEHRLIGEKEFSEELIRE